MGQKAFVIKASDSEIVAKTKVSTGEERAALFTSPERASQYRIDAGLQNGWSVKDRNLLALLQELERNGVDEIAVDAVFDAPPVAPVSIKSLRAWARSQEPGSA